MNAPDKVWSVGKENPVFLVMVELVRFRRRHLQFGQFSPARTVFLYLFSAALSSISDIVLFASFNFVIFFLIVFFWFFFPQPIVQSPTSSCLLLLIFVFFFVIDFSFLFFQPLAVQSPTSFFSSLSAFC